jgi:two-component system phosphate regulon sensor histidine kinase PhoR
MRRTIFWKVYGGYVLVILAISGLFLFFSLSIVRSYYQATFGRELENLARALDEEVLARFEGGQTEELDGFIKKKGREVQARITVIDPQGVVLADSIMDPKKMENHRYRPEVMEALEGKIGRSQRYSQTVEENMLYVGLRLEKDGRTLGVLRLSAFTRDINAVLGRLKKTLGIIVGIMVGCSLILALALSLHFVRPIQILTKAARYVAAGDFEAKVIIRRKDEFGGLAEAFNGMTARITGLFSEVNRRREELSNVIASIREGLLVLDSEGRVALANESFARLIGEVATEGRFYWEVVRKPAILEVIGRVLSGEETMSEEVRLEETFVLCTAGRLGPQGGLVLTIHDITDLRRTEMIKRDLVVNISHELRTPLTAIMGAVETLVDEDSGRNPAALEILRRHTVRLLNILDDLLKLSELEDRNYRLDVQDTDVLKTARDVLEIYTQRLKDKGLEAKLQAAESLPYLKADPFQIEQMLINLVDNAIKYTDRGEIAISLSVDEQDFVIKVQDTGMGIPAEHLPRIFERFYVVNKSRSRRLGGTGLGLSIVKHIVELHNGTISIESVEGRGTTFTIRFPLYGLKSSLASPLKPGRSAKERVRRG